MPATATDVLTFVACHPWADAVRSTPLADFHGVRLMGKDTPYRYDRTARAYLSRPTFDDLAANQNYADWPGLRCTGRLQTPGEFSTLLRHDDLPQLEVTADLEGGPRNGLVIVVPVAGDGRDPGRAAYALRPAGEPPPGVLIMCV